MLRNAICFFFDECHNGMAEGELCKMDTVVPHKFNVALPKRLEATSIS